MRLFETAHRAGDQGSELLAEPRLQEHRRGGRADLALNLVGGVRSRVNFFMNKFRELGFIEYKSGIGGIKVRHSLLGVVLRD